MRSRAFRRHQARRHQIRRLTEDRAQHGRNRLCGCFGDAAVIGMFKDTPCRCSCWMCGNGRRTWGDPTFPELRQRSGAGRGGGCCGTAM
jgi:hypothetical protein